MRVLCVFALLLVSNINCDEDSPVVKVKEGEIRGLTMQTFNDRKFFSFRGIPYAKPPVGELRFKLPQAADPWDSVLDATDDGPICPQLHYMTRQYVGQEDCLILNVFTPKLPTADESPKLPVMVFIYGGGFVFGESTTVFYGPKRLLDKDIVLVTFNYRLGPLGFMSTGNDVVPGNMGLWDQNLVLKWIQENIAAFGGDPESVTLFGESAGGASVTYHILSEASKGLFHKAILQSGSALCPWAFQRNPMPKTEELANKLSCPTSSSEALVECLRKKKPADIVKKAATIDAVPLRKLIFLPVLEKSTNGPKFLEDDPQTLFETGKFNKCPVISGVNKDEGIIYFLEANKKFKKFDASFVKEHLDGILTSSIMIEAAPDIRKVYFEDLDAENFDESKLTKDFIEAISDIRFKSSNEDTLHYLSKHVPTYFYILEHVSKHCIAALLGLKVKGVSHADDLPFLFDSLLAPAALKDKDKEVSEKMIEFWTNFAKSGNPNADGNNSWETCTPEQLKFFRLGDPMQSENYISTKKRQEWKKIAKKFKILPSKRDEL